MGLLGPARDLLDGGLGKAGEQRDAADELDTVLQRGHGDTLLATNAGARRLVALLAAVFPANVHMALHPEQIKGWRLSVCGRRYKLAPWSAPGRRGRSPT